MVKMRQLILICAGLLLCAGGLWYFLSSRSEETIIRRRLQSFAVEAGKQEKEGGLSGIVSAGSLGNYFADPASCQIDGLGWLNGSYSPEAITSNALRARRLFRHFSLRFQDLTITVQDRRAHAGFTAVLEGRLVSGDAVREIRDLETILVKPEKKWLFQSFQGRKIIRQ